MITANISLDFFSIILSLVPVLYLLSSQRYKQRRNQYFLGICISNIFMILGDLGDWSIRDVSSMGLKMSLYALTALFYIASAFVLYFFARYISEYLQLFGRIQTVFLVTVTVICGIQVFFAAVSPFTGAIFYVNDSGYQRGSLFFISQAIPLICYILFTALVIAYRKNLTSREIVFFLLYIFVPLGGGAAQMLLRGIAVVNVGVAFALLFILVNIQFEHELTMRRQEEELAKQRIDIMLSQIQPHFLYNALGTIAHLCRRDPVKAEKATEEFALFLRGNMDSLKKREPIPFEKELNHVKNYLYLEQQRFQERLRIVYDIQAKDFYVPPLSLQPLVENAVHHGILHRREGGTVTIRTAETDGYAVVAIVDDGIGMENARHSYKIPGGGYTGVGIENVRSRIQTVVKGSMEIQSSAQGTTVTLKIPLAGEYHAFFGSR
ncbi:sensor histidine kinase [Luxibacter massiliensis]|uniref:sensor histidine kinase n=1 Tax=Luxibacter massiliensis TaxID=2219695 RepID=UPI001F2CA4E8|nr:histidine kinase [Luxibacter massiliensis]